MTGREDRDTITLICFPYGGGSSYFYRAFQPLDKEGIKILAVELPGHGMRMGEELLTDLESMVQDIIGQHAPTWPRNYAFFGHSMGALLAWLVAREVAQRGWEMPRYMFVSGCPGPAAVTNNEKFKLPTDLFFKEIKDMGGVVDEVLGNPELMEIFEPILRADYQAVGQVRYQSAPVPDVPILVLTGDEEPIDEKKALAWQRETTGTVDWVQFPGKHFFLLSYINEILDLITTHLNKATVQ